MADKPSGFTHLFSNHSLVPKTHPVIRLRGKLDMLQALCLEAGVLAREHGRGGTADALDDVLAFLRALLSAEVTQRPIPELSVSGLSAEELHRVSHDTTGYLGVGWVMPSSKMGPLVSKLNLLRAACRDVEIAALDAMGAADHVSAGDQEALLHGLNRLSNAVYVLVCREVAGG